MPLTRRKKPPGGGKLGKQSRRRKGLRNKRKPTTKRAKLTKETLAWVMEFFRGLPCVICAWERLENTNTCGHHLIPRSRSRAGLCDPRNIIPLCSSHHTMGNHIVTESTNTIAVTRFSDWMREHMPGRWEHMEKLDERSKQGPLYSIAEIEKDHFFWGGMHNAQPNPELLEDWIDQYNRLCNMKEVEPWAA